MTRGLWDGTAVGAVHGNLGGTRVAATSARSAVGHERSRFARVWFLLRIEVYSANVRQG